MGSTAGKRTVATAALFIRCGQCLLHGMLLPIVLPSLDWQFPKCRTIFGKFAQPFHVEVHLLEQFGGNCTKLCGICMDSQIDELALMAAHQMAFHVALVEGGELAPHAQIGVGRVHGLCRLGCHARTGPMLLLCHHSNGIARSRCFWAFQRACRRFLLWDALQTTALGHVAANAAA